MKYKKNGFTLVELLVVLVIITLLASTVGPKFINKLKSSEKKIAKVQVELFVSALDTYRLDVGQYPTTEQGLNSLRVAPTGTEYWDGPYLPEDIPLDPWKHPYVYRSPVEGREFALFSFGADGQEGGEDKGVDIGKF